MDHGAKLMIGYSFLIRQVPEVARFGYKKNLFGKDQQQFL